MSSFKILFFGDIVGAIGRQAVAKILPTLRKEFKPDLVVANVENLAHGAGITAKTLEDLDRAGVDAYTSGNHVWQNPLGLPCFDDPRWKDRLIRPANVTGRAGRGSTIIEKNGVRVLLVNLLGQLFMKDEVANPFFAFDEIRKAHDPKMITLVDFHAETTSEKEAFGHYVDGRASAVFGTHTHVPTADMKILPGGTAYLTDVGRNGLHDSVVGFEKTLAVKSFLNPATRSYELPTSGTAEINAVLLTVDSETGKALALTQTRRFVEC